MSLQTTTKIASLIIVLFGTTLALTHLDNWYTLSACALAVIIVVFGMQGKYIWYPRAIFAFLVAQFPFLIVNGILTGIATPEPVVWYSAYHIVGIRIFTIPVEDVFYNFSMLIPIIGLYHFFKARYHGIEVK